jgi:N-acetylmuramoyl-L-alanine amidase
MFMRLFIVWGCLFILSGCVYRDEPMPKITYDYTPNSSNAKIVQPSLSKPAKTYATIGENIPSNWFPPLYLEKKWIAIVIHHSGTEEGNTAIFDKWHRESNHWEGVGYDFVIGNGTDSGDGQVEVTFRWRNQETGAHTGQTPGNWANKDAIGICLVGNFNQTAPTAQQMQSLVKLVGFLQNRYGISKNRIYGHNTTPGARATDCPGRNFPMARLKSMLVF